MADRDPAQDAPVMHAYLDTLLALAESIGEACPPVGGAYQQRVARLRTRLSFSSDREAVELSASQVRAELKEYSAHASRYLDQHISELRHVIDGLEEIGKTMVQRQDFYALRMRQLALRMETTKYPEDPELINDAVAIHSFELADFAETMRLEGRQLREKMQELHADADARLTDTVITDPLTGLLNRREMERRLAARRLAGNPPRRMLFRLEFFTPSTVTRSQHHEVIRQAAARLASQCRPEDLVCRWGDAEFLVMYRGSEDTSERRGQQMKAHLGEDYSLENGQSVAVRADVEIFEPEPALV
jgi:GGDEF domain-containing protein